LKHASDGLLQQVQSLDLSADDVAVRTEAIRSRVMSESKYITNADFTSLAPSDLHMLYQLYDRNFFSGQIGITLGSTPLDFELSGRLTRSAGKTAYYRSPARRFLIGVSTTLLFGCFTDNDHRSIVCSGIVCHDRLDALLRVMEHELVHLIEFLLWEKSSCARSRFHSISLRAFAHTENVHSMITPVERARQQLGIAPGVNVSFVVEGERLTGVVNRVTKRATVLVEGDDGRLYSDGKKYLKYYVPLTMLEVAE
jgi:hypothetical protein